MAERLRQYSWVQMPPKPAKLDMHDKIAIQKQVARALEATTQLKEKVYRLAVKAGRVYLYTLFEPRHTDGATYTVPLIEGKYVEYPLGRLTLYDVKGEKCTADWQRHNEQWMPLHKGSLSDCLSFMDQDGSSWFCSG
jgi:hypothetical protein